ncbi:flagellar biosynthesis protein FlhB [Thalassotalea sp. PLHSN55]|uniref:flagellar biosynthesis protein FlhB n=1 Tax=Thalassotalea sp. PLHSN55 TaxID=3435888 RepID=UPI003F87E174
MSENSSQEKTENASQQKIDKARKEGQLARSKELNTAGLLLMGGIAFLWFAPKFSEMLTKLTTRQFQLDRYATRETGVMAQYFTQAIIDMLMVIVPFIAFLNLLLLFLSLIPGGYVFALKAVQPKLSKLNPLKGLKRMVSSEALVELIKSILKISLITATLFIILHYYWHELFLMAQMPFVEAIEKGLKIVSLAFIIMGSSLITVALIDIPYQRFAMLKKLKMTKQEVKEEHKNAEGRPEIKQRIKQIQRQLSESRLEQQVPNADVVLVNPTHYAVAIKYQASRASAPFVVAKGVDNMAARIKELAKKHQVEVVASPELTRAVYYSTQVEQEIPGALYTAVAYVLTHIMKLKAYRDGRGQKPQAMPTFSIPDSLKR